MKKFRKLIPALAMLLVSAVLMSTASYAWFSMNNVVTATGMKVTAAAEGGIEIKFASSTVATTSPTTTWSTEATADHASNTALYPTSTTAASAANGVITSDWYHASAAVATASAAKAGTYAALQTVATKCTFTNGAASGNGVLAYEDGVTDGKVHAGTYYVATTYQIAKTGAGAVDLKVQGVTVTGSSTSANLNKSLRVAVACGSNVVIYAPVGYTAAVSYKVCTSTAGTPMVLANGTMPDSDNVTAMTSSTTSSVIAATIGTEASPTSVTVYIWYEGEDSNLFTNNAVSIDNLTIAVDFVATVQ